MSRCRGLTLDYGSNLPCRQPYQRKTGWSASFTGTPLQFVGRIYGSGHLGANPRSERAGRL